MDCSGIAQVDQVFRYIIELPMKPYKIQLYTFQVQGSAFSYLGSPTITFYTSCVLERSVNLEMW